jgi:hypothetical protein
LANELTQTGAKLGRGGSRSVWQILDDYRDRTIPRVDRKRCAALLLEYAAATKGTKALKWSPGLKDRFGIGDTTDEDLACEEADADTYEIAEIGPDDWPAVVRHQVQAHLLTVAEDHGSAGVARVVAGLRAITERHPAGADGCGSETGAPCAPVTASAAVSDSPPACSLGAQGRVFPDPLVSVIP